MIGARPSVGSSSSRTFGLRTRARAIASICCSPPESWLPRCARRSVSRGKQPVHAIHRPWTRPRDRGQVLLHRERLEDVALLRHPADAGDRARLRGRRRQVAAVEHDRSGEAPRDPHDRVHERRLAGAVAPEHRQRFAARHRERNARDHDRFAVAGRHAVEAQKLRHRPPRGRRRAPAGRRRSRRPILRSACFRSPSPRCDLRS